MFLVLLINIILVLFNVISWDVIEIDFNLEL